MHSNPLTAKGHSVTATCSAQRTPRRPTNRPAGELGSAPEHEAAVAAPIFAQGLAEAMANDTPGRYTATIWERARAAGRSTSTTCATGGVRPQSQLTPPAPGPAPCFHAIGLERALSTAIRPSRLHGRQPSDSLADSWLRSVGQKLARSSSRSRVRRPGSGDSGQTMGEVLVDALPPSAVHLCVDMQRFFSSGLPLTFPARDQKYTVRGVTLQALGISAISPSRVLPSYSNAPLRPCVGPCGRREA